MVNLLACGLSTATNSTPESISVAINARFRESRSLGGEAETGFSLPICADAEISDELAVMGWHYALSSRSVMTLYQRLDNLQQQIGFILWISLSAAADRGD
jgi:hypothetical protein